MGDAMRNRRYASWPDGERMPANAAREHFARYSQYDAHQRCFFRWWHSLVWC
jgi:hypothetical protein